MRRLLIGILLACGFSVPLFAQGLISAHPTISSGDTAWMLMATALVMLMTPGLAFFYGGLVRKKNVLGVLMQCMMALAVLSVMWVLVGYSLSFARGTPYIGSLKLAGLVGIGMGPSLYAPKIPAIVFVLFEMMFAVITPALVAGAFVERMKFSAYIAFIILWSLVVYYPVCHWVWGKGGWLAAMGVRDFAGGIVVHITAGFAALVTAVYIGRRKNSLHIPTPHNLPFTVLGAAILWFGWFGFNAGSAFGANAISANAFLATNTSAAIAAIVWAVLDRVKTGKSTLLGTATGAVAGLATVTPASGFVTVWGALAIGASTAVICYFMIAAVKPRFKFDDTLDAFGVHGMGGLWGTLMLGVFAVPSIDGVRGLVTGAVRQLEVQALASLVTVAYTVVATFLIIKLIDVTLGVRVPDREEAIGLDLAQHNERAYTLVD